MSALLASLGGRAIGYLAASLLAAGLCAAVVGWVHHLQSQAAQIPVITAQLDQAQMINSDNRKALLALQADRNRQAQIASAARKSAAATGARIATIERSINDAKPSDDGPLARVLADSLRQLRQLAATPARPN